MKDCSLLLNGPNYSTSPCEVNSYRRRYLTVLRISTCTRYPVNVVNASAFDRRGREPGVSGGVRGLSSGRSLRYLAWSGSVEWPGDDGTCNRCFSITGSQNHHDSQFTVYHPPSLTLVFLLVLGSTGTHRTPIRAVFSATLLDVFSVLSRFPCANVYTEVHPPYRLLN